MPVSQVLRVLVAASSTRVDLQVPAGGMLFRGACVCAVAVTGKQQLLGEHSTCVAWTARVSARG